MQEPPVLSFETRDADIFSLPAGRPRLEALQRYFFPRLDRLVTLSSDLVTEIYGVRPSESMSFIRHPNPRPPSKAKKTDDDLGWRVYVGLAPRREKIPLRIVRSDGRPYNFGPSYLTVEITPAADMSICFTPFVFFDDAFVRQVRSVVRRGWTDLAPVMECMHIRADTQYHFPTLAESVEPGCDWVGPSWHLPLTPMHVAEKLQLEFAALYPLLDTTTRLARGLPSRLGSLVKRFVAWYEARPLPGERPPAGPDVTEQLLGELGSYRAVRAGLWWDVLAADGWKCRSCGRGPADGVSLEVDHIEPRSRGGSNERSNLQTLCRKCNIGKSNRHNTALTAVGRG